MTITTLLGLIGLAFGATLSIVRAVLIRRRRVFHPPQPEFLPSGRYNRNYPNGDTGYEGEG